MKVAMLDPSAFTPPYDHYLCSGLANQGMSVRLFATEATFFDNQQNRQYSLEQHFYKHTNNVPSDDTLEPLRLSFKGVEHLFDMARLVKTLQEWKPDIIHIQWLPLPIVDKYYLSRLKQIAPVIFTAHNSTPYHNSSSSRIQLLGANDILTDFDKLIVHTEYTKAEILRKGISENAISIIPHGVLPYDSPQETAEPAVNRRILFFGTIKPYKGISNLLRSFARLPSDIQFESEVYIAGQPMMPIEPLKDLASELGIDSRVHWDLRYIPDDEIPILFESADVIAFPYNEIDQSGALMTALQFGKPIVATAVGGFPEVLEDGTHGRLVPPDDPDALASGLAELLEDTARSSEMGEAVRTLAETTYSWAEIAGRTIDLYKKLAAD